MTLKPFPDYIVTNMAWLFAILFGVWALPHTVFIRHTAMVMGAILGIYTIWCLWINNLFKYQKNAIPVLLIVALFFWVTIHLLLIGKEPGLQWFEYARIWKKIFLCFPFALGLGLGIRYVIDCDRDNQAKKLWRILYFGLCSPTLIFFIKFGLTKWAAFQHVDLNPFFVLTEHWGHHSGMPKYFYVFFCLPAFAISLAILTNSVLQDELNIKRSAWHLLIITITPIIFYLQSDRNGMLYAGVLILVALGILARWIMLGGSLKQKLTLILLCLLLAGISTASFKANSAWRVMAADLKVAWQMEEIDNWKYQGHLGVPYPLNEYGVPVNPSNYERATWGMAGLKLSKENLLGYGLMTLSFDHLTKEKWPNSFMSQTHSAWLDFALGYGIPGVAMLMLALILTWYNSRNLREPWRYMGRWALGVLGLVMCTTEISSEIFINALIFLIVMIAGLTMNLKTAILRESCR